MKIVAEYDIEPDSIDLEQWNEQDVLNQFGRSTEPFEDAEDLLQTVCEALDNGEMHSDELTDNFNVVITWSVQE